MGRYHPGTHESPTVCRTDGCGAKNAPPAADEYDPTCWRFGEPLTPEPAIGDDLIVDIIDTDDRRNVSIGKTDSRLVLFLDREVAALEARVRITVIDDTAGHAEILETL